jgi:hypothetical protein
LRSDVALPAYRIFPDLPLGIFEDIDARPVGKLPDAFGEGAGGGRHMHTSFALIVSFP